MSKRKTRLYMILGSAVGAAAVVYGMRRGMRWWNSRQEQAMVESHMGRRAGRYDTSAPVPQTPGQPPAHTMTEPPSRPPAQSPSQAQTQPRHQPVDQPDRQSIPTTGPSAPPVSAPPAAGYTAEYSAEAMAGSTESGILMDNLVGPLIEYAIAFNSVMTLLRSKQRDSEVSTTGQAFTPGDRSSMRNVLEQLRERLPEINPAEVEKNALQKRVYRLVVKLRDSLERLDYSEADLFRINGEVRSELCSLTGDLEQSGKVTITGLGQLRQLYECGG